MDVEEFWDGTTGIDQISNRDLKHMISAARRKCSMRFPDIQTAFNTIQEYLRRLRYYKVLREGSKPSIAELDKAVSIVRFIWLMPNLAKPFHDSQIQREDAEAKHTRNVSVQYDRNGNRRWIPGGGLSVALDAETLTSIAKDIEMYMRLLQLTAIYHFRTMNHDHIARAKDAYSEYVFIVKQLDIIINDKTRRPKVGMIKEGDNEGFGGGGPLTRKRALWASLALALVSVFLSLP
jgi:hypothetical protein